MGFPFTTLSWGFKIFSEALKIFFRSGKTLISIALLSSFIYYTLSLPENSISTEPFVPDFRTNKTRGFEEVLDDLAGLYSSSFRGYIDSMKDVKGWFLFVARYLAYLFFAVATILVSTAKHCNSIDLQIGDLISLIAKSWQRALITSIYKKIIGEFLDALLLTPHILSVFGRSILAFILSSFIIAVVSPILIYYITTVCNLGLVVSVVEKKSGFEALGKAVELVKGSKLKAFLLNIVFLCALSLLRGLMSFVSKVELVALALNFLVNSVEDVFMFISFTVLYCECKKIHGQEVGNEVYTVKYAKLPVMKSI